MLLAQPACRVHAEPVQVIADVETALGILKQANSLIDGGAHHQLRQVLAFVRAQQKFDPKIVDLVPVLVSYFANQASPARRAAAEAAPTTEPQKP